MLGVTVVPNQRRPGVGQPPRAEPRRAWLPQQSRFCPVLEDGSRLGVLVYPPLEADEIFQVRYVEGGHYRFSFHKRGKPVFTLLHQPSGVGFAAATDELLHFDESAGLRRAAIPALLDALVVNIGGLHGGIGLRGAYDFVTPPGWDTIYTGVLNAVERPHVPSLTVRVETDWFTQPTEFRYALEVGEGVSASGITPVGQVFFVPREPLELREATPEERARFARDLEAYWARKPGYEQHTAYGGTYDHQYRLESRTHEAQRERAPYTPSLEALARSDGGVSPDPPALASPSPPPSPDAPSAPATGAAHPGDAEVRRRPGARNRRGRGRKGGA